MGAGEGLERAMMQHCSDENVEVLVAKLNAFTGGRCSRKIDQAECVLFFFGSTKFFKIFDRTANRS
jgi:hypothetical protein